MNLEIFNTIAIAVSIAGSLIIIWGALVTFIIFIRTEFKHTHQASGLIKNLVYARLRFGSYLLLSLDFMLAADIIHTIHNPALNELFILALIVAIRSVISFFLTKEMKSSS